MWTNMLPIEFLSHFPDIEENISSDIPEIIYNFITDNNDNTCNTDTLYNKSSFNHHIIPYVNELHHIITSYIKDYINSINIYDSEIIKESMIHYYTINTIKIIDIYIDIEINAIYNTHIVNELRKIILPPQRSPEWYKMRTHMLTASSLADAMGKGHFNTRNQTLLDKCFNIRNNISSFVQDIMQHGVKYEDVACAVYEQRNDVKIIDFGLLPHNTLKSFGASPDGIVGGLDTGTISRKHIGRMLEIKVPPKRVITDEIPWHYWTQVQGQLEVSNLEEADFLQVKIEEYGSTQTYKTDNLIVDGEIVHGKTSEGMEKGCVISYRDTDNVSTDNSNPIKYIYSEFHNIPNESVIEWKDEEINKLLNENKDILQFNFWKITKWSCILCKRDKEWFDTIATPEIIKFWWDVEYWRAKGPEELQMKFEIEKQEKIALKEEAKLKKEKEEAIITKEKQAIREKKKLEKDKQKQLIIDRKKLEKDKRNEEKEQKIKNKLLQHKIRKDAKGKLLFEQKQEIEKDKKDKKDNKDKKDKKDKKDIPISFEDIEKLK